VTTTDVEITRDSLWYPKHKSGGTFILVVDIHDDLDAVTIHRWRPGEKKKQELTIRKSTLLSRYDLELE
jgi:hypothetical protein